MSGKKERDAEEEEKERQQKLNKAGGEGKENDGPSQDILGEGGDEDVIF